MRNLRAVRARLAKGLLVKSVVGEGLGMIEFKCQKCGQHEVAIDPSARLTLCSRCVKRGMRELKCQKCGQYEVAMDPSARRTLCSRCVKKGMREFKCQKCGQHEVAKDPSARLTLCSRCVANLKDTAKPKVDEVKPEIYKANRWQVKYDCPNCEASLFSPIKEAGIIDTCPSCKNTFVVPGKAEKEQFKEHLFYGRVDNPQFWIFAGCLWLFLFIGQMWTDPTRWWFPVLLLVACLFIYMLYRVFCNVIAQKKKRFVEAKENRIKEKQAASLLRETLVGQQSFAYQEVLFGGKRSPVARRALKMTYEEFISLRRTNNIDATIDLSTAMKFYDYLPQRYRVLLSFWSYVWMLSIPGFIIAAFFTWGISLLGLYFITPAIFSAVKGSGGDFVIEYAEQDEEFYNMLIDNNLLGYR